MSGRPQAVPTVQVDNAKVIVTERRSAPGMETGCHHHGHDYVVIPLTDGTLLLETPEGDRRASLVARRVYLHKAGAEHNVINTSAHKVVFVGTEIK